MDLTDPTNILFDYFETLVPEGPGFRSIRALRRILGSCRAVIAHPAFQHQQLFEHWMGSPISAWTGEQWDYVYRAILLWIYTTGEPVPAQALRALYPNLYASELYVYVPPEVFGVFAAQFGTSLRAHSANRYPVAAPAPPAGAKPKSSRFLSWYLTGVLSIALFWIVGTVIKTAIYHETELRSIFSPKGDQPSRTSVPTRRRIPGVGGSIESPWELRSETLPESVTRVWASRTTSYAAAGYHNGDDDEMLIAFRWDWKPGVPIHLEEGLSTIMESLNVDGPITGMKVTTARESENRVRASSSGMFRSDGGPIEVRGVAVRRGQTVWIIVGLARAFTPEYDEMSKAVDSFAPD